MKYKTSRKSRWRENVLKHHHWLPPGQVGIVGRSQAHSSEGDLAQGSKGDVPSEVEVAYTTVSSFCTWSKRVLGGATLRQNDALTAEACRDALLDDFDEQISRSKRYAPLWRQPFHGRTPLPRLCHELLVPSSRRIILCDVLDTRVSILHRPAEELKWACVETGKDGLGGCSHFTYETLMTDIPESMDVDPGYFAKEAIFYSNMPFPGNCDQLALRFLPRVGEFARSAGLTTLHLTFQALRVLIPTVSGVLSRRIPSLGLAAWMKNSSECESIRSFRHETVQEVLLSGNQHRQENLDATLLPSQMEPALDAYVSWLRELFTDAPEKFACGGWLAARMFREALSRKGFDQCLLPPQGSLSLWPILLSAHTKED